MNKKILKIIIRCLKEQNLYNGIYDKFIQNYKHIFKTNILSYINIDSIFRGYFYSYEKSNKHKFLDMYMKLNYDIPKLLYKFLKSNNYLTEFVKYYTNESNRLKNIEEVSIVNYFYSVLNRYCIHDNFYATLDEKWNYFLYDFLIYGQKNTENICKMH